MPLRSVEAATRDDAIAAAREQFGASARVVGVRRVRSGGVLGFFATERYVAEVDPDPAARPAVPVPAPSRASGERRAPKDDVRTRMDDAASRSAVPARNGATAYAEARATPSSSRPGARDDDARVDELAGLLGQDRPAHAAIARPSSSRIAAPRPPAREAEPEVAVRPAVVRPAAPPARPAWSELLAGAPAPAPAPVAPVADTPVAAAEIPPVGGAATPSPFTAALARMVAGDRDVQRAVEDALAAPGDQATADPGPRPTRPGPLPAAETTVSSPVAPREEEPVELQDWTPSSAPLVEAPADWDVPAVPAARSASSREEAIAEVLRAALDEGRSDEALPGLLRKVMDGAAPAVALAETPVVPAVEEPVAEPVAVEPAAVVEPVVVEPVVEYAPEPEAVEYAPEPVAEVVPEPVAVAEPVDETPVVVETPAVDRSAPAPLFGSELGWDDPVSSSLWAEIASPARSAAPAPVVLPEAPAEVEAVAVEAVVAVETAAEVVAEVEETEVEETEVQQAVVEQAAVEETAVEELADAPLLARTASDPAPLSLDATSVMPPLSLLPPLPSSRRGGRPPVPPLAHRGASARPAARPAPTEEREVPTAADRFEALATVTRLPLVPAEEIPAPLAEDTPAEPDVVATAPGVPVIDTAPAEVPPVEQTAVIPAVTAEPAARRPEPVVERPPVVVPAPAPRAARPRPAVAPHRPAAAAAGDPVSRLQALGLPEQLLDADFAADAATQGTYAALTRALAEELPETPELPSGAGEVLVLVGPGVETLRAARALAATLRLDPDRVQWATRGDLAGLAPAGSRMATVEAAIERRHEAIGSGTVTVVAVDAPLRTDTYWTAQMLAIWAPVAVWAVVEATRKPEDLGPWLEGLPRVDALMVQDTDLSADPAAVLHRVALPLGLPVAVVDGMRATPHRWASLLCERLETPEG